MFNAVVHSSSASAPMSEREDILQANYIQQNFKKNPFPGALTEWLQINLRGYHICARQHLFIPTQKADYFANFFASPALISFFYNASGLISFDGFASKMIKEFNSNSC